MDSPMVSYGKALFAAKLRGATLGYEHKPGDFSAIIAPSMNPFKIAAGFADPFTNFNNHIKNNSFEN